MQFAVCSFTLSVARSHCWKLSTALPVRNIPEFLGTRGGGAGAREGGQRSGICRKFRAIHSLEKRRRRGRRRRRRLPFQGFRYRRAARQLGTRVGQRRRKSSRAPSFSLSAPFPPSVPSSPRAAFASVPLRILSLISRQFSRFNCISVQRCGETCSCARRLAPKSCGIRQKLAIIALELLLPPAPRCRVLALAPIPPPQLRHSDRSYGHAARFIRRADYAIHTVASWA